MPLSPQFKALGRVSGFFAAIWAAAGALVGAILGPSVLATSALEGLASFALMYGTAGGIAGAATALLVARAESGKDVTTLGPGRIAAWGMLGGSAPAGLFGALGLLAGAPVTAVAPLLGLGLVGGAVGGLVTGSAVAVAKSARLSGGERVDPTGPLGGRGADSIAGADGA